MELRLLSLRRLLSRIRLPPLTPLTPLFTWLPTDESDLVTGWLEAKDVSILLRVFSASATGEMVAMGSMEASLEEEEDVFPFPRPPSTQPPSLPLSAFDRALSKKGLTLLVNGLERPIV